MRRAALLLALAGSGAAIGVAVVPATAQQRLITVTLLGGKQITVTVDVPPGTPLDQVQIPGVDTPILSIAPIHAPSPVREPPASEPRERADRRGDGRKQRRKARKRATPAVHEAVAPSTRPRRLRLPSKPPSRTNPTFSLALPGPAPIGVPSFFIEKFRIPPFLLPIYQAAGTEYGVRWEILAAINEIETDYGRNLNVSSAGAVGWMQFMPSSWRRWAVDANADGRKDPYNPVDAIFSAARYLRAANVEEDVRGAIFAYNHADWYVDSVLLRARLIGGLPTDLVGSLTGLTQGRFPVHARATYARPRGRGIAIFARTGAPAIAVQDGKVVRIGRTARLGRFVKLRDAYGNTYTYAHLKRIPTRVTQIGRGGPATGQGRASEPALPRKERLFANPRSAQRPAARRHRRAAAVRPNRRMRQGTRVPAGTILGRIGPLAQRSPAHLLFEIRPTGRGAPRIDPKPILDGWKLLESTALYRAKRKNPLVGGSASIGQILLMSKETLARRVLSNPRIGIYDCGRQDIRAGIVDRRVLAALEFLAASGLKPTVTSLRCGHGYFTKSGNVSHHSFGSAVDIAKVNGIPIAGHQGADSIADMTVRRLLTLQGVMKPSQIISLMTYTGADNTFAMADHADHIHVGWRPLYRPDSKLGRQVAAILKPNQWIRLIDRLNAIENPRVLTRSR